MVYFDDTTLPIVKPDLEHSLDHDFSSKNHLQLSLDELLPWIKKCNPVVHEFIQYASNRAERRSLMYVADIFEDEISISEELKKVISAAACHEVLIAATQLYMILDRQGQADRLREEIEGK